MTRKISVRLVGGMADGQRIEVEDMRDGWPFYAAVIAEESVETPIMSGPEKCFVKATRYVYKLASVRCETRDFRFGIPEHWTTHDAFAHLFGPSYFGS